MQVFCYASHEFLAATKSFLKNYHNHENFAEQLDCISATII